MFNRSLLFAFALVSLSVACRDQVDLKTNGATLEEQDADSELGLALPENSVSLKPQSGELCLKVRVKEHGGNLTQDTCNAQAHNQRLTFREDGRILVGSSGLCLTLSDIPGVENYRMYVRATCNAEKATQVFQYNAESLSLKDSEGRCVDVYAHNTYINGHVVSYPCNGGNNQRFAKIVHATQYPQASPTPAPSAAPTPAPSPAPSPVASTQPTPVASPDAIVPVSFDSIFNVGESCPASRGLISYEQAMAHKAEICAKLSTWAIARIAGGGSMDGPGYGCGIRSSDSRGLGHSICSTAGVMPKPFAPIANRGESCPPGYRHVTLEEANANKSLICSKLSTWAIARLANGGSMDGEGYGCGTRASDSRGLGDSVCAPN